MARLTLALAALPAVGALILIGSAQAQLPVQSDGYDLVASYPHDPEAFTQGLEFKGARFYETTGIEGESSLRRVDLETGTVTKRADLSEEHFGEGMTIFGDRLFWITWTSHKAFVYDPQTFERLRRYTYAGEGWGLTHNRRSLIMSNGSARLFFRDPKTFEVRRRVTVRDEGKAVDSLNELEWVQGEVLANVWQTTRIARIDPSTGRVVGWIDIRALRDAETTADERADVANGIAYMKEQDRLFVTGKYWRHVYEIDPHG